MLGDKVLAGCELAQDLLYGKIPENKRTEYIDASLDIGRAYAKKYAGQDIYELYKDHGIEIVYHKETKKAMGVLLRGQAVMSGREKRVELYRSSIESLAANSSFGEARGITPDQAEQIHLAHEFFHYLEFIEGKSVAEKLPPVLLTKILGWKRYGHINRCSEIAAHAFAKEFLKLPYLPNAYDYFYLIRTGKMTETEFREILSESTK
jgi:hypothetical protein